MAALRFNSDWVQITIPTGTLGVGCQRFRDDLLFEWNYRVRLSDVASS